MRTVSPILIYTILIKISNLLFFYVIIIISMLSLAMVIAIRDSAWKLIAIPVLTMEA